MTSKHKEESSTSLVIRVMQIKTVVRQYFTSLGWLLVKKWKVTCVDEDIHKLEPSYITGGHVKLCGHCGNSLAVPQKVNTELPCDLASLLLGIYPKELKTDTQKTHVHKCLQYLTLFMTAKWCKQRKCPSVDEWTHKMCISIQNPYSCYSGIKKNRVLLHSIM